jgi:hypothetical protein
MRPVKQIWDIAISPTCLPATLLLAGTMVYWIIGLVGLAGDGFDVDTDDGSAAEANSDGVISEITSLTLRLLNAKGIPFMLVMSILSIYLWGGMVFGIMNLPTQLPLYPLILTGGSATLAIALTSLTAIPLKPLFAKLKLEDAPLVPIVGRVGIVRSNEITSTFGQVEVPDKHGPMLINAHLSEGHEPLAKNASVLIISLDQEKLVYTVCSTESP